jgi:Fe-S-cluster containining protein
MKIKKLYHDLERVTVRVERAGGPSRTVQLSIPRDEIALAELVPQCHKLFNAILEVELAGQGITCRKGCSACCNQLVPLSIPEAFFLRDAVNRLNAKKRARVLKKMQATTEALERAGLLDDLRHPGKNRQIDADYFGQGLPCPFLEDDACSIYAQRPFICRSYVVTSPKEACADPYANAVEKVEIKRNLGALLAAFAGHLLGVRTIVPLITALEWTEQYENLNKQRRPGMRMLTKLMECLQSLNDEGITIDVQGEQCQENGA